MRPFAFVRENPVLIAAGAAPLAAIALFAAATALPLWVAGAPAYDAVIAHGSRVFTRERGVRVALSVVDGRARARVVEADADDELAGIVPRLFVFDGARREATEIEIRLPGDASALAPGDELAIPALADAELDPAWRSPDGWRFEASRERPGLFTGLFGGWGGWRGQLVKNGAALRVRTANREESWHPADMRLIGWIVSAPR